MSSSSLFRRKFSSTSLADAFEVISRMRCAERSFSPEKIPSGQQLLKILQLTQLAPSSFNLQPYKGIVVQSEKARVLLSSCMLGGNKDIVLAAPITVIFIGDIGYLVNLLLAHFVIIYITLLRINCSTYSFDI